MPHGLLSDFLKPDPQYGRKEALASLGFGLLNMGQGGNPATIQSLLLPALINKMQQHENPQTPSPQASPIGGNINLPVDSGSLSKLMGAIGKLESENSYSALGKMTNKGDRAFGRYQVMGANIPSWTKEVLGSSMTPDEFLQNPAAQDAVAKSKLGAYLNKYGNINDAASMWFSGRPMHGNTSHDILGTSVPDYVKKINQYYSA